MKKGLICAILLAVAATTGFAATGWAIGGEGSFSILNQGGLPAGAMVSMRIPRFPVMIGVGVNGSPFDLGVTVDYWALRGSFARFLTWYGGVGAYSVFPAPFTLGARFPFALQLWPIPQTLEVFLEVAPAVGIDIVPTGFDWHVQAGLGVRVWF